MQRRWKSAITGSIVVVGLAALGACIWFAEQIRQDRQSTALLNAIRSSDARTVAALLDQGANPNIFDEPRKPLSIRDTVLSQWRHTRSMYAYPTALELALGQRSEVTELPSSVQAIVTNLLSHGADPRMSEVPYGAPLLLLFTAQRLPHSNEWEPPKQNAALFKLLIDAGADINVRDQAGQTPLILAAQYDFNAVAKLLLDKGADANAIDSQSIPYSALKWAEYRGNSDLVKLLKSHGASR